MSAPVDEDPPRTVERVPEALSTPEAWLDPFDWYAEMRERDPVRYDDARGCWDVFRYEDVDRVLDDPETFSSNPRMAAAFDPADAEDNPVMETMLLADGERHDRLRGVVEDAFRPRALADRADRLETVAADLLDEAIDPVPRSRASTGAVERVRLDFVDDFAYPFPVIVIAELLGVPAEDRPRFRRWSETLVETPTDPAPEELANYRERQERVVGELTDYFEGIMAEREADPRDDIVSEVVHAEVDGQSLTHEETLGFCMLLLVAGNITTTNLLGNAMRCLTAHPEAMARLQRGEVTLDSAIEEVLRYRSPVQALARFATRDVELGDRHVEAGDAVVTWLGSANRDPAAFDAADEFRVDRAPNPHFGFGRGSHYCLGAPLARMEARIGLSALFERVTDVERATDDLQPVRSAFIYGVRRFPLTVTPDPDGPASA